MALLLAEVQTPISVPTSRYPLYVVNGLLLEIRRDLTVVFADMFRIPTIAASLILAVRTKWEGRRGAFQCNITCTHDRLSDVLEAVVHMPRLLNRVHFQKGTVECNRHRVVSVEYCVQAV